MSPHYDYPGVYIEEVTGPGVIAGVGTSTAGFIGPALAGPMNQARRVTTFDDFVRMYGGTRDGRVWPYLYAGPVPYYLAFAVEAFFRNGGAQAFVVRVGTARQSELTIRNRRVPNAEAAFVVRAVEEGSAGDQLRVAVETSARLEIATASTQLTADANGTLLTVASAAAFRIGDTVTAGAAANTPRIAQIQGTAITLDAAFAPPAVDGDTLRIADLAAAATGPFRLLTTQDLTVGSIVICNGVAADRAEVTAVNAQTGFVTLKAPGLPAAIPTNAAAPFLTVTRRLVCVSQQVTNSTDVVNARGETVTRLQITGGAPNASKFLPGDVVKRDGAATAVVDRVEANMVFLTSTLAGPGDLRLALIPGQTTFRIDRGAGLSPGGVLLLEQGERVVIASVSASGIVSISAAAQVTNAYDLTNPANAPTAITDDFRLVVSSAADSRVERIESLSLNQSHPRYVLNPGVIGSDRVEVAAPPTPPTAGAPPAALAAITAAAPLVGGVDEVPGNLTAADYQAGLGVLRDVDDVNLVVIPDAASHPERRTIQQAQVDHCVAAADRFAILDPAPGIPPFGPGSVDELRDEVTSDRGFAALYYPWVIARDPTSSGPRPRTMALPPSGAIAGVYARTDQERGVHKAPANTDVRGVLGLEQRLSDRQQGPLNEQGVNVLRIFPGDAQVIVWGARTTVQPDVTDWLYVNVRRLLLYIEESVQEGIRWAVFEGNDLALWQKLSRTVGAFLTGVWRDGGLFGATAAEAFQVRIDEGLNPPSERALGRLHIEIKVAPVRPAEFIIVRIGLWDGGGDVSES